MVLMSRMSRHRLYNTWYLMLNRCNNKKAHNYKNYGKRGITVCDEWHDLSKFIEDMEDTHRDGLSLDRIENTLGYCKENCRWATQKEQMNNCRINHLITFNGITLTVRQWADKIGVKYQTLLMRISSYGWSEDIRINKV